MMLRVLLCSVLLALTAQHVVCAESKAIALVGSFSDVDSFEKYVTEPLGVEVQWFAEAPPSVHEYQNFSMVVFIDRFSSENVSKEALWSEEGNLDTVREYLNAGGKILITGAAFPRIWIEEAGNPGESFRDLSLYEEVLGFSRYPKADLINPVNPTKAGRPYFATDKVLNYVPDGSYPNSAIIGNVTGAEILATIQDIHGEFYPYATKNRVGKGTVFYFRASPSHLAKILRLGGTDFEDEIRSYAETLQKALRPESE